MINWMKRIWTTKSITPTAQEIKIHKEEQRRFNATKAEIARMRFVLHEHDMPPDGILFLTRWGGEASTITDLETVGESVDWIVWEKEDAKFYCIYNAKLLDNFDNAFGVPKKMDARTHRKALIS